MSPTATGAIWNISSSMRSNCAAPRLGYNSRAAQTRMRTPRCVARAADDGARLLAGARADPAAERRQATTNEEQQRANATRPVPEHVAQRARAGLDLPRQWDQAPGSDRVIRPVRRAFEEHRHAD